MAINKPWLSQLCLSRNISKRQINKISKFSTMVQPAPNNADPPKTHPLGTPSFLNSIQRTANNYMNLYEEFIGIKQVKEAHARVLTAETNFKSSQNERRAAQKELSKVQQELRMIRGDIDRTPRGDHRYLELIKNEIDIIKNERAIRTRFDDLETKEREMFAELSNALRFSHEKEKAQNEKTKYWSIIGSIIGACIGIIGTTLNSRWRNKQIKSVITETQSQVQQMENTVAQLAALVKNIQPLEDTDNSRNLQSKDFKEFQNTLNDVRSRLNENFQLTKKLYLERGIESIPTVLHKEALDNDSYFKESLVFDILNRDNVPAIGIVMTCVVGVTFILYKIFSS